MTAVGFPRDPMPSRARTLFALGPHYALGALFSSSHAFGAAVVRSVEEALRPSRTADALLISVHVRHRGRFHLERGSLEPYARAVREVLDHHARCANRSAFGSGTAGGARGVSADASGGSRPGSRVRCAILFAADRRASGEAFGEIARALGCDLVRSPRGRVERGNGEDNGDDTGSVAMADLLLLSHGHHLVGSWGSTLTLSIQELMSFRYEPRAPCRAPPTARYCDLHAQACLPPLPLVGASPEAWWHLSLEGWPAAAIRAAPGWPRPAGRGAWAC